MADTQRTRAHLLANVFQNGQAANSISAQDMRDFIVSIESIMGNFWEFWLDSQYVTGARRAIVGGTRTKLTCDGLLDQQFKPVGHPNNTWNAGVSRIEPQALSDFYEIRLAISGASDAVGANHFDVELDVGGTAGVIYENSLVFAKGTNDESFNLTMGVFVGADFFANGGEIYVTPENDAKFWQSAITINRTYKVPV